MKSKEFKKLPVADDLLDLIVGNEKTARIIAITIAVAINTVVVLKFLEKAQENKRLNLKQESSYFQVNEDKN